MKLQNLVYKKLCEVPKGRVTTYGELARAVGLENGPRVIGMFMNKNPYPGIVPCHRVIKSDGKIGGYAYGTESKTAILNMEGVRTKNGRVCDFEKAVFRF